MTDAQPVDDEHARLVANLGWDPLEPSPPQPEADEVGWGPGTDSDPDAGPGSRTSSRRSRTSSRRSRTSSRRSRTSSRRSRTSSDRSITSSMRQEVELRQENNVFRRAVASSDVFGEAGWERLRGSLLRYEELQGNSLLPQMGNRLYDNDYVSYSSNSGIMLQIWLLIASCIDYKKLSRLNGIPKEGEQFSMAQRSLIELDSRNSIWKKDTKQLVTMLADWLTPIDGDVSSRVYKLFITWVSILNCTFIRTIKYMNKPETYSYQELPSRNSALIHDFINLYEEDLREAKNRIARLLEEQGTTTATAVDIDNMARESMNEKIGFDVHEFYRDFVNAISAEQRLPDGMQYSEVLPLEKITIDHIENRIGSADMYELVPKLVTFFLNRGEFGQDWVRAIKLKFDQIAPEVSEFAPQVDFGGLVSDLPTIKYMITKAAMTHLIVMEGADKTHRRDLSERFRFASQLRQVIESGTSTREEIRSMARRGPGNPDIGSEIALLGYPLNISSELLGLLKPFYESAEKVARLGARNFTSIGRLYMRRMEQDPENTTGWLDRRRQQIREQRAREEQERMGHGVIRGTHTLKKKTKKGSKKKTKMKRGHGRRHNKKQTHNKKRMHKKKLMQKRKRQTRR